MNASDPIHTLIRLGLMAEAMTTLERASAQNPGRVDIELAIAELRYATSTAGRALLMFDIAIIWLRVIGTGALSVVVNLARVSRCPGARAMVGASRRELDDRCGHVRRRDCGLLRLRPDLALSVLARLVLLPEIPVAGQSGSGGDAPAVLLQGWRSGAAVQPAATSLL